MKIKVIGKAHLEGKSKRTGKEYNFNQVHYTGPDRGVDGLAALTLTLDPSLIPYAAHLLAPPALQTASCHFHLKTTILCLFLLYFIPLLLFLLLLLLYLLLFLTFLCPPFNSKVMDD